MNIFKDSSLYKCLCEKNSTQSCVVFGSYSVRTFSSCLRKDVYILSLLICGNDTQNICAYLRNKTGRFLRVLVAFHYDFLQKRQKL